LVVNSGSCGEAESEAGHVAVRCPPHRRPPGRPRPSGRRAASGSGQTGGRQVSATAGRALGGRQSGV